MRRTKNSDFCVRVFIIDDIVFYIEFDVIKAIPLCGIVDLEHQIIKYCCAGSEGVDMIFYYVLG